MRRRLGEGQRQQHGTLAGLEPRRAARGAHEHGLEARHVGARDEAEALQPLVAGRQVAEHLDHRFRG